MKEFSPDVDELAAEAIEDAGENAPLLRSTSPDPAEEMEAGKRR